MNRLKNIALFLVAMLIISSLPLSAASAAGEADLLVSSVAASTSVIYDGDYVRLQATIRNIGDTSAPAGTNITFYADGKLLQSVATKTEISSGSRSTVQSTAYWNPVFGSHKITASVNAEQSVSESDFSNNIIRSRVTVLDEINPSPTVPIDNTVTEIIYSDTSVTLKNASGIEVSPTDATNVSVSNNTYVEIISEGTYSVSGQCADGGINVNVDKDAYPEAVVTLELMGLDLESTTDSPIYVTAIGDECVISAKKDTVNTITDGESYTNADGDAGAIYAKDDIKFKGKGTLNVYGNSHFGISCSNDIKIWNSTLNVYSKDIGIKGKDSVRIGDPDDLGVDGAFDYLNVKVETESGDAIRAINSEETDKGYILINGGTIDIDAYTDGLYAVRDITINGGDIDIYTYTGAGEVQSGNSNQQRPGPNFGNQGSTTTTDVSAKAIKAGDTTLEIEGTINITGGNITIDSTDDGFHSAGTMTVTGGTATVKSGDDGFHSDTVLDIRDGAIINVTQAYEGLEAHDIEIQGGNITLNSSDDGLNAAGGNDSSGNTGGGWNPGNMSTSTGTLNISGGYIYVRANGDGVDSNGDLAITGGTVIVCGPTSGGNGIFDKGDGNYTFTISNATVFCVGSSDMFETPSGASYIKQSTQIQADSLISIANSNGSVLSALHVPSNMNMNGTVFFTSPSYTSGSYSVYKGGTYSGTLDANGYAVGGTISGATKA